MADWQIGLVGLALASGINLYAAVLALGVGLRMGWISALPPELRVTAEPIVIGVAAVLYAAEFAADKVPFFTPIWDSLHTFIRPLGAAMLAVGVTAGMSPLTQMIAVLVSGSVALGAHSVKTGFRMLLHAVPEPVTHSAVSILEDFGVVAIVILVWQYPWVALPVIAVIFAGVAAVLPGIWRSIRFNAAVLTGALRDLAGIPPPPPPWWVEQDGKKSLPAYVRRAAKLRRFEAGYLIGDRYYYRRWFKNRVLEFAPGAVARAGLHDNWVYPVLQIASQPEEASFYLTRHGVRILKGLRADSPVPAPKGKKTEMA
jgi:hypothetical protein